MGARVVVVRRCAGPATLARLCGAAADALNSAEMRLELAIPSSLTAVAPIIVGVPAQPAAPIDRREPDIIAWK